MPPGWGGPANASLNFELRRSSRRTLAIHVQADGRVVVRSPRWVSRWEIDALLLRKHDWIRRKQAEFAARRQVHESMRHAARDQRYFLGIAYRLEQSLGPRSRVDLEGDCLRVTTREAGPNHVTHALDRWYGKRAREVLPERLEPCMQRVRAFGLPTPELKFRRMRSRWGSCTHRGRITLNTELVKAHIGCIDYVLIHELCHLRELNHGPRFYALMDAALPDWKDRKQELESLSLLF